MVSQTEHDAELEIAHVLFIDIVGYSKRTAEEQRALVRRLNELVRRTDQFRNAEAAEKLIRLPTGDGMALAFFTTPEAPVRCAIEINRADQEDPRIELRMGIHSGPVDRLADVNERANVSGAGINMAQRVMDCADSGHILLSQRIADDLAQYGRWQPYLHQLGEVEVKHGVRLGIVNFYSNGVGNPVVPQKVRAFRASYIEAFHAPALIELFGGTLNGTPALSDPVTGIFNQVSVEFTSNPNLQPEVAYERTFGAVLTPELWWSGLRGLTMSVDYGHIDIRSATAQLDPQYILFHESDFPGLVQRDPAAGNRIVFIRSPTLNLGRFIETYFDYALIDTFETSRLGHGDFGTFTATLNGTYLVDLDVQTVPKGKRTTVVGKYFNGAAYTHNRFYVSLFYDGPRGTRLEGLDTGAIVHFVGQFWDDAAFTFDGQPRKVREWTTLDLILNYTFASPPRPQAGEVAGYSKAGTNATGTAEGKASVVSTAEYSPSPWKNWLKNTTITLGVNNVFNLQPPFVAAATVAAGSAENGYDETSANPKGRFWYVALKKRF